MKLLIKRYIKNSTTVSSYFWHFSKREIKVKMCWREAFYLFQRLGIFRGKRKKTFFGEKGGFNMKSDVNWGQGVVLARLTELDNEVGILTQNWLKLDNEDIALLGEGVFPVAENCNWKL